MNPTPSSPLPFNPPPRLVDTLLPAPGYVPVTVTRGFPATYDYLDAIERLWGPQRAALEAELRSHGETLESGHWDWRNKSRRLPHWHTLVTVEYEGAVQGIAAVENLLRRSALTPNAWVLYLDDIEIAPWNNRVPQNRRVAAVRDPRFKGVGAFLLGRRSG
jgi:hypothetical protein